MEQRFVKLLLVLLIPVPLYGVDIEYSVSVFLALTLMYIRLQQLSHLTDTLPNLNCRIGGLLTINVNVKRITICTPQLSAGHILCLI